MKIISYEILGLDSENYRTKYFLSIGTENSRGQEDGNNKRQVCRLTNATNVKLGNPFNLMHNPRSTVDDPSNCQLQMFVI